MKVKVKKTRGVTGNQHNYGLVTGSIWNYEDKPTTNTVGTTLSPVPREEANIEAEKNETIVYPDKDGMLAHAKIGGKRHAQGGTPLNVPDGSFVFSDFRGMNIKNKELLKNIFNMNTNKAVTPADIAKRYEINYYKEVLKDPWADPMDKKTAQLMIENNMRKLGQLALIQEGMKGFPDGIPDIALPLMGSDIASDHPSPQPEEEQQEQPQAQKGKQVKKTPPAKSSSPTIKDMERYRLMMLQKAAAEGNANMSMGEWENMYKPKGGKGEWREVNGKQVFSQDWIAPTESSWFGDAVLGLTHPFATLMSTGDRTGNSWQSYVREHGNNPIDYALNGLAAIYAASPSLVTKAPALLQTAAQIKNANNMRNAAILYNMGKGTYGKQTGGLIRAQNGVQIPGIVTNKPDSLRVAQGPMSPVVEGPGVWDKTKDLISHHRGVVGYGVLRGGYEAAKKLSPTLKQWADNFKGLDLPKKLKAVGKGAKWFAFENPWTSIITMLGADLAIDYFFPEADDKTKQELKNEAKTVGEAVQQAQQQQSSYSTPGPSPFSVNNPTQRTIVLDAPKVVTDTTKKVTVQPKPKVTNSTNLQKSKSSNSSGSTSSQSSGNSGAYVKKGDPSNYAGTYNRAKDSIVVKKKQTGGSIGRYQGGGGKFDVERAEGAKRADELGFYMKRPAYFDYTSEVGDQNPNSGDYVRQDGVIIPAVKDKSGNKTAVPWSYTDPKTGQTTTYKGVDDIVGFADPYINFKNYRAGEDIGEDEMGVDAWKRDLASTDEATRRRAGEFYVSGLNSYNAGILGDPNYETIVTKNPDGSEKKGYWEIGTNNAQQGFFEPYVKEVEEEEKKKEEEKKTKTEVGNVDRSQYEEGIAPAPWWNYDVVNYANQLGNYFDIEPGNLPAYMQYSPYLADPTFLDPARAIAQQQGLARQSQEAIMSGADPTTGRANVIAAGAQAAPQVANIMAQYDQNNVGIANQYGQQAAQSMNQAQLQNMQMKKQYLDELETRRQQYQNALAQGKTNVAQSIMQGMKNAAETSWMNATSDSYAVDPSTGQVYFKRGFDPITGSYRGKQQNDADLLRMYMSDPYNLDKEDAIDLITGRRRKKSDDDTKQMGGMLYNPMDVIWNY